jgi:hypothetical protein
VKTQSVNLKSTSTGKKLPVLCTVEFSQKVFTVHWKKDKEKSLALEEKAGNRGTGKSTCIMIAFLPFFMSGL